MNFTIKGLIIIGSLVGITACGGGGSDTPETPQVEVLTKDLKAESSFDFSSAEPLSLSVTIDESSVVPDRITVCRVDEATEEVTSECLYSGGLTESGIDISMSVPNDAESLAAVLWYFKPDLIRKVEIWDRTVGNDWDISL